MSILGPGGGERIPRNEGEVSRFKGLGHPADGLKPEVRRGGVHLPTYAVHMESTSIPPCFEGFADRRPDAH